MYILDDEEYIDLDCWEQIDAFNLEDSNTDEILQELKQIAPHIIWRTQWGDYETNNGSELKSYISIVVPLEQEDEARSIYESWESGEDLDDNISQDKYDYIYYIKDDKKVLCDDVYLFLKTIHKLNDIIEIASKTNIKEILNALDATLSELYFRAHLLPEGPSSGDYISPSSSCIDYIFQKTSNVYQELEDISDNVIETLDDLEIYLAYIEEGDTPKNWANIVWDWKYGHRSRSGWGETVIKTLNLIHQFKNENTM